MDHVENGANRETGVCREIRERTEPMEKSVCLELPATRCRKELRETLGRLDHQDCGDRAECRVLKDQMERWAPRLRSAESPESWVPRDQRECRECVGMRGNQEPPEKRE